MARCILRPQFSVFNEAGERKALTILKTEPVSALFEKALKVRWSMLLDARRMWSVCVCVLMSAVLKRSRGHPYTHACKYHRSLGSKRQTRTSTGFADTTPIASNTSMSSRTWCVRLRACVCESLSLSFSLSLSLHMPLCVLPCLLNVASASPSSFLASAFSPTAGQSAGSVWVHEHLV